MAKQKLKMQPTRDRMYRDRKASEAKDSPTPAQKPPEYRGAQFYLPHTDLAWIEAELERYRKATKIRLKKSHVVHIALELVRKRGGIGKAIIETTERSEDS